MQVKAINDEGNSGWSASGTANTQDKNVHAEFPKVSDTRSIAENSPAGSNVGAAVTATDTEGHTLYYSLNGTDKDVFTIGLNDGQIKVKAGYVPDYEAKTSYSVKVEVSDRKDSDDNADTKIDDTIDVTITVNDVNEPPRRAQRADGHGQRRVAHREDRRVVAGPEHGRQARHQRLQRAVPQALGRLRLDLPQRQRARERPPPSAG